MLSKNKVKYIQTLYHKKQRHQEKLFIVEGEKMVMAVLEQKIEIVHTIYALPTWIGTNKNLLKNTEVVEIDEDALQKISNLATPNAVLAILKLEEPEPVPTALKEFVLALDGIQDPGNLGTIIRTANWFGIRHIICSTTTVDCYNPKVIQSTMSSFLNVQLHYTNLAEFIQQHKQVPLYAALLNGTDVRKIKPTSNGILLIGNEGNGISDALLQLKHQPVSIIGTGNVESLNAAVATGILLSHLVV